MNDDSRAGSEVAESGRDPGEAAGAGSATAPAPRVGRRSTGELSAEERAFLERYRRDLPPHHDSSWG